MEVKKSFVGASTSGSQEKLPETSVPTEIDPSVLTTFLETCMKHLCDSKAVKGLKELTNKCSSKENAPKEHYVVETLVNTRQEQGAR